MEVVELFQDEVQFLYGVISRVSAALAGTLFLSPNLFLSNSDSVDLSFALLYNGSVNNWTYL